MDDRKAESYFYGGANNCQKVMPITEILVPITALYALFFKFVPGKKLWKYKNKLSLKSKTRIVLRY